MHVRPGAKRDFDIAQRRHVAADLDAESFRQPLAGDGTGRDAHGGFARGGSTATTVVADAVLLPIGVIGVTGTEGLGDFPIITKTPERISTRSGSRRCVT